MSEPEWTCRYGGSVHLFSDNGFSLSNLYCGKAGWLCHRCREMLADRREDREDRRALLRVMPKFFSLPFGSRGGALHMLLWLATGEWPEEGE